MTKFTIDKIDTRTHAVNLQVVSKFEIASVDKEDFDKRMQRLIEQMNELISEFDLEKVSK